MGWYKRWASKQSGNPFLLLVAGVSATLFIWIGYRKYYKPWQTRRSLHEAEEYAKFLLKEEEANK